MRYTNTKNPIFVTDSSFVGEALLIITTSDPTDTRRIENRLNTKLIVK